MKPPPPHDPATAEAWLAWCAEIDPLTRNRNHAEGCQCHGCLRAREIEAVGRLCALAMERVREEIEDGPGHVTGDALAENRRRSAEWLADHRAAESPYTPET